MLKPKPYPKIRANPFESKKPLKLNNYTIDIKEVNCRTLHIYSLFSEKNQSYTNLPATISEIKKMAKRKGYTEIKGNTWIFAEHPKIAEKLGVIIENTALLEFNKFKKTHNIIKILGVHESIIKKGPKSGLKSELLVISKTLMKEIDPKITKDYLLSKNDYTILNCIVNTEKGPVKKLMLLPFDSVLLPFVIKL